MAVSNMSEETHNGHHSGGHASTKAAHDSTITSHINKVRIHSLYSTFCQLRPLP